MQLPGLPQHLAYCTNIHPAETWDDTFRVLQTETLRVRDRVAPDAPFAIGLRLSDLASRQLIAPPHLAEFAGWLVRENCYIFTINGFPYGQFHGTRVKEQVYRPDWSSRERVEYTVRLFEILAALVPAGVEGSVSTLPATFKEFALTASEEEQMLKHIWECAARIAEISARTGKSLHLGFEPEPLGWFETSLETVAFFHRLRSHPAARSEWFPLLGVNYDTCHLAIEFETAEGALDRFEAEEIRISKIHLSSALALTIAPDSLTALSAFVEPTYLHQVIVNRGPHAELLRFRDLPEALPALPTMVGAEARVHFHVPLHWQPEGELQTTFAHTAATLQRIIRKPMLCSHLEIETYTWSVLPTALHAADVADQIEREYRTVRACIEAD